MGIELNIRKLTRCALETCRIPLELSIKRGSKRRYCSDAHRKYAWKKRHWDKYLSWQRDYMHRKQSFPTGIEGMNASGGALQ